MAKTAQALLLEAIPSLEKNHGLLVEMLMRPDGFTMASLGCNVRVFLERNGVDVAQDLQRMKLGAMAKRELDRHLELVQQLEDERELLASLMAAAGPRVQRLDGMPRAHGTADSVGCLAAEIADMRETIAQREAARHGWAALQNRKGVNET